MKKSTIFVATTMAVACSSTPTQPSKSTDMGGSTVGGSGAGQAAVTAGAAGTTGSVAGAGIGGASGGADGGAPGGAGAPSAGAVGAVAGAGGAVAAAGATGASGAGGAGGSGGTPGAAGAPVDPGNLMSFIPAGYTGTPYGGTPQIIPGKIEVEKYDLGGLNVAFKASTDVAFNRCGLMRTADAIKLQCTGQAGPQDQNYADCTNYPAGSVYVGYINPGDWYKYTVDVVEAGTYVISGHEGVAANTQLQFTFTDAEKTQPITLPPTGGKCTSEAYHVWAVQDNLGEIALTPGKYVLTVNVVAAAMNLDWFAFTKKP